VLFATDSLDGIADGSITVAFRRWRTARARPGSVHRTPAGRIGIDTVDVAPDGPWTGDVLVTIDEHPGTRAADLAADLGRQLLPFKRDARKLKELGLTESLEVGSRLSPRGRAFLASTADR
jgi:hypothetical protein